MIDPLRRLYIIFRLREEYVFDESLGVAIVEREPARLDLHHHAVSRLEDMIRLRQSESVREGFAGFERSRMRKVLAITTPKNIHSDGEFIAAHLGLRCDFVGININQFNHPVAIGAGGRGGQVNDGRSTDSQGCG